MTDEVGGATGRVRRAALQIGVVVVGLGLGVGGVALWRNRPTGGRTVTPSATRFSFAQPAIPAPAPSAPADVFPGPAVEPADAGAALSAFLEAQVQGRGEDAWRLLDGDGHHRWPTPAAWAADQAGHPAPTAFDVTDVPAPSASGQVGVKVDVRRHPTLDPYAGLVAARSSETWRVGEEDGHWRVAADPVESQPALPADATAPDTVRGWLARSAACDGAGAAKLQAGAALLGPADLAAMPCTVKGEWTVGDAVTLDRGGDASAVLAAYGPGAATWARSLRVQPSDHDPGFWVEVAPLGESWTVVGVAAGG